MLEARVAIHKDLDQLQESFDKSLKLFNKDKHKVQHLVQQNPTSAGWGLTNYAAPLQRASDLPDGQGVEHD